MTLCVFDSECGETYGRILSVNMLLEEGGGRGGHWRKRKAKIKYDSSLFLCCRIWIVVTEVGQRSNLILFRKISLRGMVDGVEGDGVNQLGTITVGQRRDDKSTRVN